MKYFFLITFMFNSMLSFAQAAYMHEVYEDSLETEPLTIGSLLTGLLFMFIIYVGFKIFSSAIETAKKKRLERDIERKRNEKKMDDISNSIYDIITDKNKESDGCK